MLDTGYWMLDNGCWLLVSGYWSPVAEIVNSESDLLIQGVFLYSFFFHYNLALIFSELFLEFKHIFREYAAYCRFKTLCFAMIKTQSKCCLRFTHKYIH